MVDSFAKGIYVSGLLHCSTLLFKEKRQVVQIKQLYKNIVIKCISISSCVIFAQIKPINLLYDLETSVYFISW